jgi:hypothetical protein
MGSTIRRALAATPGSARTRDRRYDYSSERLCELLGVDAPLAAKLGLRQLIPADLRAERNKRERTRRRRAAGALPRPIWEAANPISRLKPWESEGISRAKWYRRPAAERERQLAQLETGPVPLYQGRSPRGTGHRPGLQRDSQTKLVETQNTVIPAEKPTRGAELRTPVPDQAFAIGGADQSPRSTSREFPMQPQSQICDMEVFRAAAQRLADAELGAVTRLALALAAGPAHRLDLARRAGVPPDMLGRLDGWLQITPDADLVIGLVVPALASRRARSPRQGMLFEETTVAPAPSSSGNSNSLKAHTIRAAIRVLGRAGIGEHPARSFAGQMIKEFGFGALAEALDALEPKVDDVADPRGWIKGLMQKRRSSGPPGGRVDRQAANAPVPQAPIERSRPLATPEFLGISPGRAAEIRERNRRIAGRAT